MGGVLKFNFLKLLLNSSKLKLETSWAELGLTQAETVSLELKLKLSLFDLTDPPPTQIELTKQILHIYLNWFRFKHIYRSLAPN